MSNKPVVPARSDLRPGQRVLIELKKDQRSGRLTEGVIKTLLTKKPSHTYGIKVRLESGAVGRVKKILADVPGVRSGVSQPEQGAKI